MTVTVNIVAERLNRGLTIAAAARLIGISHATLDKVESGELPREDIAKKIADFYGLAVTQIWPLEEWQTAA